MERRHSAASHTTARTAVVWQVLRSEIDHAVIDRPHLSVIDVGGGTGGFAVPLALRGHDITVIDPSPDALAALARRAAEAGVGDRIRGVQGDADALSGLVPSGEADLVLCHSVLEVVDVPDRVASALMAALRPGGAASVIVANRAAAVLTRAVAGHLDTALAVLRDPAGCAGDRDVVRRRFDTAAATDLLRRAGLAVERVHGVRVVVDMVPGEVLERDQESLIALELAIAGIEPFRDIASKLHLLARRPVGSAPQA